MLCKTEFVSVETDTPLPTQSFIQIVLTKKSLGLGCSWIGAILTSRYDNDVLNLLTGLVLGPGCPSVSKPALHHERQDEQ